MQTHPEQQNAAQRQQTLALCRQIVRTSQPDLVVSFGRHVLARFPNDPEMLLAAAQMFVAGGDLGMARDVLSTATKLAPNGRRILRLLGEVLLRLGDAVGFAKVLELAALARRARRRRDTPWRESSPTEPRGEDGDETLPRFNLAAFPAVPSRTPAPIDSTWQDDSATDPDGPNGPVAGNPTEIPRPNEAASVTPIVAIHGSRDIRPANDSQRALLDMVDGGWSHGSLDLLTTAEREAIRASGG